MLSVTGVGFEAATKGLCSILWVAFAFSAMLLFRPQIIELLARVRRGKIFGQEFEADAKLAKLDREAESLSAAVQVASMAIIPSVDSPARAPQQSVESRTDIAASIEGVIRSVVIESEVSPRAALLLLSATLEREM